MPVLNSVWLFLKDILSKSSNEHAPITNKHVKGRLYPWLKVEIKAPINFKNQLHRRGRKSNKVTDWKICKNAKNAAILWLSVLRSLYSCNLLSED